MTVSNIIFQIYVFLQPSVSRANTMFVLGTIEDVCILLTSCFDFSGVNCLSINIVNLVGNTSCRVVN